MDKNEKNIVIGTAGHVDHGKTALVKVLTGIDTDRLKEEKERGMTIEPGFAYLELPSGRIVSVVDVPGHERFIKNMLRGITGVDIALLVVAADDGVMPQTREHLDILKLLNIKTGLTVISKADLVDEETLSIATEEVRDLIQATFLETSPIIPFSAKTGLGAERIIQGIEDLSDQVVEKSKSGVFRLPIDRVFTMSGYGTVVTGTIASGKIKKGATVEVYPIEEPTPVRNIQIHSQWVDEAFAGQRVGLNLSNFSVDEIKRGMVLSEPQALTPTHLINAKFHYLESNLQPLSNRLRIKFYSGTTEVIGRMVLMEKERLFPGESSFVQFRLEQKIAPLPYDRYIVRTLSPVRTIGGGLILEVRPRKYSPIRPQAIDYLKVLEIGDVEKVIKTLIDREKFNPLRIEALSKALALSEDETRQRCKSSFRENQLLWIGEDLLFHRDAFAQIKEEILKKLKEFHEANPKLKDASQEEIRLKISSRLDQRLYEKAVDELKEEGRIGIRKGRLKLVEFQEILSEREKTIYENLDRACKEYRFRPLPLNVLHEMRSHYGEGEVDRVLKLMVHEGRLIQLKNQRLIHSESIEEIKRILKDHIEKRGKVFLSEAMEVLGIGRTQAQPIFEYLDSIRFTIRVGDYRILREGRGKEEKIGGESRSNDLTVQAPS